MSASAWTTVGLGLLAILLGGGLAFLHTRARRTEAGWQKLTSYSLRAPPGRDRELDENQEAEGEERQGGPYPLRPSGPLPPLLRPDLLPSRGGASFQWIAVLMVVALSVAAVGVSVAVILSSKSTADDKKAAWATLTGVLGFWFGAAATSFAG
jgi:hypothetical protein